MESYWFNMTTLNITAASCIVMLVLVAGLAGLSFVVAMARGRGFGHSMGIASSVVFIPMLLPAFAAALLVTSSYITIKFMGESVQAQGQVIGHQENYSSDSGTTYSAIVQFSTANGQTVQFEDDSATCDPPCYKLGEQVNVRYIPTNPDQAIIDNLFTNYIWMGVSALLTVVFFISAIVIGVSTYRKKNYGDVVAAVVGY